MRLQGFNLNQLVSLDALLKERNVTRAAERVHLSQSAMSAVLAQLREHFGDPLLVRSGRSLVLTPFAQGLVVPLNDVIARAHSFSVRRPDHGTLTLDRELRIVASDYSYFACLADVVTRSFARNPGLRFEILPLTEHSARLLSSGEIDLLLAGQSLDLGLPPQMPVFEDNFACVTCAENGLDEHGWTAAKYLEQDHVVVRYFESRMAFEDEDAVRHAGGKRTVMASVSSYSMVPGLITGSKLVATVPEKFARKMADSWPVRILPFPFEQRKVQVFAYWHPSRTEDAVLKNFVAELVAANDEEA